MVGAITVDIPDSLIEVVYVPNTAMWIGAKFTRQPILKPEITDWCRDNGVWIKGPFGAYEVGPWYIKMRDEGEAVLFKLRWL